MTSTTLTLAEFLLARISEDEAFARSRDFIPCFVRDGRVVNGMTASYDGDFLGVETYRVLAECEAQRKIVGLHTEVTGSTYYYGEDIETPNGTPACAECGHWGEYAVRWPCPTLRALAAIYADHPEFRDEWRP